VLPQTEKTNNSKKRTTMGAKEAKARIKINKQLEESGWRFFDDDKGKANIVLEPKVKLTQAVMDALGVNFETTTRGFY